jgi:putative ABC transport system permease protein
VSTFFNDIKYSFRMLAKNPGFTAIALVTLAIGIGANIAMFSVVNVVLLRPLPFDEPDQLVRLTAVRERSKFLSPRIVSYPDFVDWREQSRSFVDLAAYDSETRDIFAREFPENLTGLTVSYGFFKMLGAHAELGRTFIKGEDQPGATGVIVLGHKMWQRHFSGDHDVLGQTVQLDEMTYTIVGVLPADFPGHLFDNPEFFTPLRDRSERNYACYKVIGRIHPDITLGQAQERLSNAVGRLHEEHQGAIADARMTAFSEYVAGNARLYLLTLLGATGFVLLIACVNLANLILARMAARQREIAVRRALGASLVRVARQVLTESLLLTFLGGGLGVLLASWTSDLLRLHLARFVPRANEILVDGRTMCFAFALALGTGALVALIPILRLRSTSPRILLGDRSQSAHGGSRLGDALVVCEIGAALILLMGAGLMIRTFYNLTTAHPGFDAGRLLSFRVRLPASRYEHVSQRQVFCQQTIDHLNALPGVANVAMSNMIPYGRAGMYTEIVVPGRSTEEGGKYTDIACHVITSDYLSTLNIPVFSGRSFGQQDFSGQSRTVLVNQKLAETCWSHEDPLGQLINVGWSDDRYEVVGVVGNTFQEDPTEDVEMSVYLPYGSVITDQYCGLYGFVVRTHGDPAGMVSSVRQAMLDVDPALPVQRLAPMDEHMAGSIRQERFTLTSLGLFAGLALILVVIGIYGVVSYLVNRRTHEMGIRMAVGASCSRIVVMILRKGVILATTGSVIGIAGAAGLTQFLSSYLYGITPTDPITFVAVAVMVIGVTLLACVVPARRAAKIDPMKALRYE